MDVFEEYFYEALPPLFYEEVVTLENRIINEMNVDDVISLGCLYKLGVEHFSKMNTEIANYFFVKMQNLLMNGLDLNKLDNKVYKKRQTSINFLKNLEKMKIKKIDFKEIIKKYSFGLDVSKKLIVDEIDVQRLALYEKIKVKEGKEKSRKQSIKSNVSEIIENFVKKFYLVFFSKVTHKPIELTLEIFKENYSQNMNITTHYNNKIKEFNLIKSLGKLFLT
jgi:hypothetical protein